MKSKESKGIDLVKEYYNQDIDHRALEKAISIRKEKAKKFNSLSLEPYTGDFGKQQKRHLLNRTMIGFSKRHMDDLEGLSLSQAINLIFTEENLSEPTNIYYWDKNAQEYKDRYGSDDVEPNAPFINRPYTRGRPGLEEQFGGERGNSIRAIVYRGMYYQKTSIHWKLFKFLHNLVPTKPFEFIGHKSAYNYIKLLFDSAFNSYKDFIYKITIDGSMLFYLNLYLSQKETPDENYAREIQELFTVGKRPIAKFTESDVREIARALVGWTTDYDAVVYEEGHEDQPIFEAFNHDTGDKFFSSFYNNKVIRGREGPDGAQELQEVVDMLFETEENSVYIARRLYQFFVYPALTDEIEENIIKPLAEIYRENNFSLIAPLKILLKSKHFFQSDIYNSMIVSPLDFNMQIFKEINILDGILSLDGEYLQQFFESKFNEKEKDSSFILYEWVNNLIYNNQSLGMDLFEPPSVSGWAPYYQDPVYDLFWINSSTLSKRNEVAKGYIMWGIYLGERDDGTLFQKFNLINYLNSFNNPSDFDLFFEELLDRYLGVPIEDVSKNRIKNSLLQGNNVMHWEEEVNNILNENPERGSYRSIMFRLGEALTQITSLGEFNLH